LTYEELLSICDNYSFKDSAEPVKALRAVVELHSPFDGYCQRCTVNNWGELRQEYPCDEIQTIEKELG
jgi:hypothetical protein